jgi:hypothetical protein
VTDELDLETGVTSERSERRRRRRESSTASSGGEKTATQQKKEDTEVISRLDRLRDRLVKNREAAGDDELAEILREDGEQMAQGVKSLTGSFPVLRMPLFMFLNVLEPVLAFGRLGRALWRRYWERRAMQAEAAAQAQAEAEAAANGDPNMAYGTMQ